MSTPEFDTVPTPYEVREGDLVFALGPYVRTSIRRGNTWVETCGFQDTILGIAAERAAKGSTVKVVTRGEGMLKLIRSTP